MAKHPTVPKICHMNGYRIYVVILTGENLSSIQLANMDLIFCQFVHPVGGERMMLDGGIVILPRLSVTLLENTSGYAPRSL